jgi:hypothetical protein
MNLSLVLHNKRENDLDGERYEMSLCEIETPNIHALHSPTESLTSHYSSLGSYIADSRLSGLGGALLYVVRDH